MDGLVGGGSDVGVLCVAGVVGLLERPVEVVVVAVVTGAAGRRLVAEPDAATFVAPVRALVRVAGGLGPGDVVRP